jgi:LacI family transcriptional regulator
MAYLTRRHSRIGCLRRSGEGPERSLPSRYSRYAAGLQRSGLPVDQALVRTTLHQRHQAYEMAIGLLSLKDRPTALLCTDDMEALAASRAAFRLGIRIPEDLEIIGVGNSAEGQGADPPLSTVGPDPIFDEVVHMLVRRLSDSGLPAVGERRPAPWRLHHRGTTLPGAAPGWVGDRSVQTPFHLVPSADTLAE